MGDRLMLTHLLDGSWEASDYDPEDQESVIANQKFAIEHMKGELHRAQMKVMEDQEILKRSEGHLAVMRIVLRRLNRELATLEAGRRIKEDNDETPNITLDK